MALAPEFLVTNAVVKTFHGDSGTPRATEERDRTNAGVGLVSSSSQAVGKGGMRDSSEVEYRPLLCAVGGRTAGALASHYSRPRCGTLSGSCAAAVRIGQRTIEVGCVVLADAGCGLSYGRSWEVPGVRNERSLADKHGSAVHSQ